jgi:hypothetical protein
MVWSHPQYIEYDVSIDSKMVCLWFTKSSVSTAELNLELKPQANYFWCEPHDHMVTQPTCKDTNSRKAK